MTFIFEKNVNFVFRYDCKTYTAPHYSMSRNFIFSPFVFAVPNNKHQCHCHALKRTNVAVPGYYHVPAATKVQCRCISVRKREMIAIDDYQPHSSCLHLPLGHDRAMCVWCRATCCALRSGYTVTRSTTWKATGSPFWTFLQRTTLSICVRSGTAKSATSENSYSSPQGVSRWCPTLGARCAVPQARAWRCDQIGRHWPS